MLLTSKLALFSRRIFADNARVNERLHELYEQNKRTPQQQNSVSFFCKQCNPTPMNVRSEPHKYYFPQNNSTFSIDITIGPCAATVAVLIFPPSLPITYFMPSPSPNPSVPPARCSRFVSASPRLFCFPIRLDFRYLSRDILILCLFRYFSVFVLIFS